ncbi:MAG: SigE family RNA polymerase sigma factor, partial [Actinomycetia bacterium]|nr:SigE family RNA polymerase sigma factor [Actinomycetes bacterium]
MEFEEFYRDAHPRLVAALVGFCGDADVGRDAADEAVVRAFERWDSVSAMGSPTGWLFRTGFNVARRTMRRRRHLGRLLRGLEPARVADGPAGELWELVAGLGERQRLAVVLRHVADLTEPDIAEAMGVSRGTVS